MALPIIGGLGAAAKSTFAGSKAASGLTGFGIGSLLGGSGGDDVNANVDNGGGGGGGGQEMSLEDIDPTTAAIIGGVAVLIFGVLAS